MKQNILMLFFIIIGINKLQAQTNWELLNPTPTANSGKDIHFVSNSTGYIITSNEILETTDSGASWVKKQNISSGNDLSFKNNIGYIVGDYGSVLKSIDSGASWIPIYTGYNDSFNSVNIIDEQNIILSSSNSIVKSSDGGFTWQSLSIPNMGVNKTFFVNSLIGHAVCNYGTILKTIDGGQNWYTTESVNYYPSDFFTVYFVNESIGFATREHDYMFKTIDGGETWKEITGTSQAIFAFHFLDENTGFATGEYGATFKTNDGGATWSQIFFQNGYYDGTSMYGIYFQDSNIGFATGEHGRIHKTTDGGETWTQYSPTYKNITQLNFLNNNLGYGLVGNSFFKTTDGGSNWINIGSPVENVKTAKFDFINENIGFALVGGEVVTSGNTGSVFKTINGGLNWIQMNPGYEIIDEDLVAIDFIDENIGFISGGYNRRKTMKTTDGGKNWVKVSDQVFGQIQFINEQVGYANRIGTYFGAMYKTIDGGNTWNMSIEFEGDDINAFHFIDEDNGYFVGDPKIIYKTNDGGANWVKLEIPYEWYTTVKFYSKNVGYVADEDGILYKTEDGGENWKFLTSKYGINEIEIINDNIYLAGQNGTIYKSKIAYETVILHVNEAENVSNSGVTLTGNATSNEGIISNIQLEYSTNYFFNYTSAANPGTVASNESLKFSNDLIDLEPNTTYYYRLTSTYNSIYYTSEVLSFTTLSDYTITTNYAYTYAPTTAEISGLIISNKNDITNVEFQYGTSETSLNNVINGTPLFVNGNTTESITATLKDLKPGTKYYFRLKAIHEGKEIYGDIQTFTTVPQYTINLNYPVFNGNDVTLSGYIKTYSQDISEIYFEYGTLDYENKMTTNPSLVSVNTSGYVSATLTNLDENEVYYYRIKALHNGEVIYSKKDVFNLNRNIILVSGKVKPDTDALELTGFINSYGAFITNIQFEYGITESFGTTIMATPNSLYGYNTNLIKGIINNPILNQTYYYRLVGNHSGNTIYSDTYQYNYGSLNNVDFITEDQVFIYPNPATNFVNIKSNGIKKIISIQLYDLLGKLIHTENVHNSSNIKVDLSNFEKGLYLLNINFENHKTISSKLMLK